MHITVKAANAIRLMTYCALNTGKLSKTREVARVIKASENHMAKVGNELAHAGLLEAVRGRHGGVRLARDPVDIRLGDIARATQENVCAVECYDKESGTCPLIGICSYSDAFGEALDAFFKVMDRHTLQDMLKNGTEQRQALGLSTLVLPWVGSSVHRPHRPKAQTTGHDRDHVATSIGMSGDSRPVAADMPALQWARIDLNES